MSLDIRNSRIICDGEDCTSVLEVPLQIGISREDKETHARVFSPARGWTFLRGTRVDKHYCPRCACKTLGGKLCEPIFHSDHAFGTR